MVAHAVVAVCLMRGESRFGESDGFDSRWAGVDEQGKWLGWRVEDGWKRASRLRGNDTLDRAVVVEQERCFHSI
jgi:hypothetical protein